MRLKELTEDFLEGGIVEVLKCDRCYDEHERNQSADNKPINEAACKRCGLTENDNG